MKTHTMRVHFDEQGGTHTHLHIWTGKTGFTLGKAGTLTVTNEEFAAWKEGKLKFEFIEAWKEPKR